MYERRRISDVFCTKCGTDLPDDSQFCRKCGQALRSAQALGMSSGTAAATAPVVIPAKPLSTRPAVIVITLLVGIAAVLLIFKMMDWYLDNASQNKGNSSTSQYQLPPSAPPPQLHRVVIGTGALTVPASNGVHFTLSVPEGATNVKVKGHFTATGGSGNDIEVYLLSEDQYTNWQNGHATSTFYNSGRVTVGDLDVTLPNDAGTYYLVFANQFSLLTPKAIAENIALTYYSSP